MSDNNKNDFFANNKGDIKSKKDLVLAIVGLAGFFGCILLMVVFSIIPPLKWLAPALFGFVFFVAGLIFLKMTRNSYIVPLIAVMIGATLIFMSISDKFFPGFRDTIGDKGTGTIIIIFGLIILLYPNIAVMLAKAKCKETVDATVVRLDIDRSRDNRGWHVNTYRPVYEYTYSGKVYTVMDKVYSSGSHPLEGEVVELRINENKPEIFYDIKRMKTRAISSYVVPGILLTLGLYLVLAG